MIAAQDLSLPVGAAILGRPPQQAEAVLEALVDLHLLRSTSPERYQLHDLVQVYARTLAENRLSAAERTAILERVLCGYRRIGLATIELSEPSSALLSWIDAGWLEAPRGFDDPAAAFEWLDRELPTLRAVVRQATQAGGETAELVPGVVLSLVGYLMARNNAVDWCDLLSDALALDLDDRVRGMLVMHRGMSEAIAGLRDEPVQSFRDSAELFRRGGDAQGEVAATGNLGQMLNRLGRLDEAVEPIERALAINRELGNENQAAKSLRTLGNLFWMRGDHARGLETTEAALAYFRAAGEAWDIAMSLHILGEMRRQQTRYAEAVDHLLEAAGLYRSIGHLSGLMELLGDLAACHVESGAPDLAVPVFSEAIELAEELRDPGRARRFGAALDAALEQIEADG
ncbi:tetratricopeptide repeat protein [Kribbella sp. NBC_01245]|uniref:tetratricopeptide repeat protein n=1 Tax=Kribbella sp. NBC_01245 TaxID=2903578 RepID=UPI002E2CE40B|nr:tetratricopeptide repeat protein [Kribbella sp. NBC_01245]